MNVAAQRDDPGSMLSLYRRLIGLRRESGALRRGTHRAHEGLPRDVFGYVREHDGERWLVALNFASEPAAPPAKRMADGESIAAGTLRLSTDPERQLGVPLGAELLLAGEEGVLVELQKALRVDVD